MSDRNIGLMLSSLKCSCPTLFHFNSSSGTCNIRRERMSRAAKRGCFKRGGFPIWTCLSFFVLFCPFLSFSGLSRFFWDFPDLRGDGLGIFPIRPFPLSQPIKSTYEEQSRKGPRHNLDLSRKVSGKPPGLASPKQVESCDSVFSVLEKGCHSD